MPELPPLVQRVVADVTGFKAGMAEARADMSSTGQAGGGLLSALKSHLSGLSNESTTTGKALKAMGVDAGDAGGVMKLAIAGGAVAAAGALVDFGLKGVKAFADTTAEVRAYQRVSGATAEDSSKMVSAAKQLGISADTTAAAMFKLSKNVATHSDTLRADGVQIAVNNQGNTDLTGTLLNVADAYNKTQDQAAKNKIVFDAFGRAGAQMIPILQRGRDGLKDLFAEAQQHHEIFTDDDLRKGKEFSLQVREVQASWRGLQIEAGKELAPELTQMLGTLESVVTTVDKVSIKGKDADHSFSLWTGTVGNFDKVWHIAFGGGGKSAELKQLADAQANAAQEQEAATGILTYSQQGLAQAELQRMVTSGRLTQVQLDQNVAMHAAKDGTSDYAATLKELDPSEAKQIDLQARLDAGLGDVRDGLQQAADAADVFKSAIDRALGIQLSAQEATLRQAAAEDKLKQALVDSRGSLDIKTEKGRGAQQALLDLIKADQDETEATLRNSNGSQTAAQAKDALIAKLRGEEAQYPSLRGQIESYITTIQAIPPEKLFTAQADVNQAIANIDVLRSHIAALRAESNQPIVNIGGGQVGVAHGSIRLSAAGGIFDRPTLTWVGEKYRREVILPMDDPARAMSLARESGLMAMLTGGSGGSVAPISPMASGGGASIGPITIIVQAAPGMNEEQLAEAVRTRFTRLAKVVGPDRLFA